MPSNKCGQKFLNNMFDKKKHLNSINKLELNDLCVKIEIVLVIWLIRISS